MLVPSRSIRSSSFIALSLSAVLAASCGGGGDGPPTAAVVDKGLRFVDRSPIADTILAVYARSVVVELRGDDGKPIADAPVTFFSRQTVAAQTPVASFAPTPLGATQPELVVNTDGSGRAQVFMRLWHKTGVGFVVADAGGRRDSVAVTVSPGKPTKLDVAPVDTAVLPGREFQTRVVARDRGDNDVGLPIDLAVTSGAATVVSGKVLGVTPGRVAVIASLGTLRDTAWVSVVPPATFAFYASPTGAAREEGVYLMESDGSNGRFLYSRTVSRTNGLPDFGEWPTWSPDAKRIAFVEATSPIAPFVSPLRILDVAGGAPRDLVAGAEPVSNQYGLQFDQLGNIHFTRGYQGSQMTLWRVPAAGGTAVQESAPISAGIEAMASPNPAGNIVVYQTNVVTNSPVAFTLRLIDPATGQQQRALDLAGRSPRWSPLGERIAYLDDTNRLQFMSSTGAPIASPSTGVTLVPGFAWSPDGQWIVGFASGNPLILMVATGEKLPLALRGPTGQDLFQASWKPTP